MQMPMPPVSQLKMTVSNTAFQVKKKSPATAPTWTNASQMVTRQSMPCDSGMSAPERLYGGGLFRRSHVSCSSIPQKVGDW